MALYSIHFAYYVWWLQILLLAYEKCWFLLVWCLFFSMFACLSRQLTCLESSRKLFLLGGSSSFKHVPLLLAGWILVAWFRGYRDLSTVIDRSCSSVGKESACKAGDLGLIPVLGRSPGEGNGNPFQYSCLENPMDGGAW